MAEASHNSLTLLQELVSSGALACPEPADSAELLNFVFLGGSSDYKKTFLVFAPAESMPQFVIKQGISERGVNALRREHQVLASLKEKFPDAAPLCFPTPCFFRETPSSALLGETALRGVPYYFLLRKTTTPRRLRRLKHITEQLLARIFEFYAYFPARDCAATKTWWEEAVRENIAHDQGLQRSLLHLVEQIPTSYYQHGDLFCRNILLVPKGENYLTGLVDWENAGYQLPPAFDLTLFFTSLWLPQRAKSLEEQVLASFRTLVEGDSPFTALFTTTFRRLQEGEQLPAQASIWAITALNLCVLLQLLKAKRRFERQTLRLWERVLSLCLERLRG